MVSGHYKYVKKSRLKKILYVRDYKESRGCMDCGNKYPYYMLDLDHRDPTTKLTDPAQMVKLGWGYKKIDEELAKCDVVCANCHRSRTYLRGLKDKAADF